MTFKDVYNTARQAIADVVSRLFTGNPKQEKKSSAAGSQGGKASGESVAAMQAKLKELEASDGKTKRSIQSNSKKIKAAQRKSEKLANKEEKELEHSQRRQEKQSSVKIKQIKKLIRQEVKANQQETKTAEARAQPAENPSVAKEQKLAKPTADANKTTEKEPGIDPAQKAESKNTKIIKLMKSLSKEENKAAKQHKENRKQLQQNKEKQKTQRKQVKKENAPREKKVKQLKQQRSKIHKQAKQLKNEMRQAKDKTAKAKTKKAAIAEKPKTALPAKKAAPIKKATMASTSKPASRNLNSSAAALAQLGRINVPTTPPKRPPKPPRPPARPSTFSTATPKARQQPGELGAQQDFSAEGQRLDQSITQADQTSRKVLGAAQQRLAKTQQAVHKSANQIEGAYKGMEDAFTKATLPAVNPSEVDKLIQDTTSQISNAPVPRPK